MGFFGGSSQSVSSASNIMDFNPVFNIGDNNTSAQDKTLSSSQTTSPKLDDSTNLSASVGLGFGGSGSGGTATSVKSGDDTQPTGIAELKSGISSINPLYIILGVGGIILYKIIKKKK